eukprot:2794365-Pyramimonas_sp.AAC.2
MGLSHRRRGHSSLKLETATRIKGGWFSKWGSRLGAANTRLENLQQLHGWKAAGFQNGALALAPRTFVLNTCSNFTRGGHFLFNVGLAPSENIAFHIRKNAM